MNKFLPLVLGACLAIAWSQNDSLPLDSSHSLSDTSNLSSSTDTSSYIHQVSQDEIDANLANLEQGAYQRKGVSFINALWLMDRSVRNMPARYAKVILAEINKEVKMKRFDFNPVPESYVDEFVKEANKLNYNRDSNRMLGKLSEVMDRTVVKKILEAVELSKELRAASLTTDAQRNSFIVDKAKESGVTAVELNQIMRSNFVYLPVVQNYSAIAGKEVITMSMDVGIILFRITFDGKGVPKATPVLNKFSRSVGFANIKSVLVYAQSGDPHKHAFDALVENSVKNIRVAMQTVPEFKLSGQILEKDGSDVGFELGIEEGLTLDQKFRFVEYIEDENGNVEEEFNGWAIVTKVGDTSQVREGDEATGYISQTQRIAGSPLEGDVMVEYPRLPLDIWFKVLPLTSHYLKDELSIGIDGEAPEMTSGGAGAELGVSYNFGRHLGLNQLFLDVGVGFGGVTMKSEYEHLSVGYFTMAAGLTKKYYFRRLAWIIGGGFNLESIQIDEGDVNSNAVEVPVVGAYGKSGFEFAVHPAFNIGVTGSFSFSPEAESENVASVGSYLGGRTGINASVYVVYSPPSLSFDPFNFLRAVIGI